MEVLLWILAGLLAFVFVVAGLMKLATPHTKLTENPNMAWANDFSPGAVKIIGFVEIAGAVGLILPPILGIAEWLTPLAAAGLALNMLGAFATHVRRKDPTQAIIPPVVLGLIAAVVATGRFWIEPF